MEDLLQIELMKSYQNLSYDFFDGHTDTACPYGTFGYWRSTDNDTKTTQGQSISIQVDLFSQYNGTQEIHKMIKELIDSTPATMIVDGTIFYLEEKQSSIIKELDDITVEYHGVVELRFSYY